MKVSSPDDVFINCPFDAAYRPTLESIIFGVIACGFVARSALEVDDGTQTRIDKIYSIIGECRYGIHDLWSERRTCCQLGVSEAANGISDNTETPHPRR